VPGLSDALPGAHVWIDGRLVAAADAALSPFDHGFLVGDGVFETLQVVRGTPFALRRHLGRLRHSAAGLGLGLPYDDRALGRALRAVAEAEGLTDRGRLRLTVTGGVGPLGSNRGATGPTVVIAGSPLPDWPPSTAVALVPWTRNERSAVAGLKTTSYAENVVALAHAHGRGASEAVFANTAGHLCEGTGSNVFVVLDGELVTPPLTSGCLAGVTRELVCELLGDRVVQRDVPVDELARVDSAFLTSSTRDVQAVHAIDGRALRVTGCHHTQAAATALADLMAQNLDP
jgi:branched-chain amino acid aminotransferase